MDGPGDELLAGAGLPEDQDQRVRGRDLLHETQGLLDGGALPGDLAMGQDRPDLGLEIIAFRLEPVLEPRDLLQRLAQRILAPSRDRDVANDPERSPHASLVVTFGDAGHVVQPSLPEGRMDDAILDGTLQQPSVVKLLARLHEAANVLGMQSLEEGLHGLETFRHFWRNAEDFAQPFVDVAGPFAVIHLVVPKTGEVGAGLEKLSALLKQQLVSLAGEGIDEDVRDKLQPLHQRVRPIALLAQRVEAEGAHGPAPPHREGDGQVRLDAEEAAVLPIDGGLRRELLQRGVGHRAARSHLLGVPGELLLTNRLGGLLAFFGVVEMGGDEVAGALTRAPARERPYRSRGTCRSRCRALWISRSTSPGGRLMNREDRFETRVSNSRWLWRSSLRNGDRALGLMTVQYIRPAGGSSGKCETPRRVAAGAEWIP